MAHTLEKAKKANFLRRCYRETIGEIRKVTWPTPKKLAADQDRDRGHGVDGGLIGFAGFRVYAG